MCREMPEIVNVMPNNTGNESNFNPMITRVSKSTELYIIVLNVMCATHPMKSSWVTISGVIAPASTSKGESLGSNAKSKITLKNYV